MKTNTSILALILFLASPLASLADSLIPQDQMAPLPGYVRGRKNLE